MAYSVPLDQPLSESQARLLAQMGSMKNLANTSFLDKFKIRKGDEISVHDYLLKLLRSMGIDPQIIITTFLNDIFRTEKLVELIFRSTAQLATAAKVKLDKNAVFVIPIGSLSEDDKKKLTNINYNWLNNGLSGVIKSTLSSVISALKIKIIQELMIIIFGKPKSQNASYGPNGLTYDQNRLNELMDESVCGPSIFSVSSPANERNEDLEYNRIKKKKQIESGNLTFQVTCDGVDISLPDDPSYLFYDAPPGFMSSNYLSPSETMGNIFDLVHNQIQKKSIGDIGASNASSTSKSFSEKFLETLITSITCLLKPFFVGGIASLPGAAQGTGSEAYNLLSNGLLDYVKDKSVSDGNTNVGDFGKQNYTPYTSCEILQQKLDKNNLSTSQKKKIALTTILCNLLLNAAIGFILAYCIDKVKKLIQKYIVKRAEEKAKRRIEKMKAQYENKFGGKQAKQLQKSARMAKAMALISPVLDGLKNGITIPEFNSI